MEVDEEKSAFGRRRLPRKDPHLWADKLEDWFARLTMHVLVLYVLTGLCVVYIAFDFLGVLDEIALSFR